MAKLKKSDLSFQLVNLRRQAMLTQEELAAALGIKRSTYAYYESKSKPSTPDILTLKKLASIYKIPLEDIIGTEPNFAVANENKFNTNQIFEGFNELSSEEKDIILKFRAEKAEEKQKPTEQKEN